MQDSIWLMLFYILIAGAAGGVVNALLTDNGFLLPKSEKVNEKTSILRPGCLGNVLIGAIASVISWGLYGPLSTFYIAGTRQALASNTDMDRVGISLASLVGAVLVGIGGARWLTSEVDKNLLRAAAAQAAGAPSSSAASPADRRAWAFNVANTIK